ncbi:MAG: type 4a pilus biogenesis protein PilO [Phycisphaerales bacterium]|nr:type 4a pilus biogenesis protein PilO [Phycisphaerales bacterium]
MNREQLPILTVVGLILIVGVSGLAVIYPSLGEMKSLDNEMRELRAEAARAERHAQSAEQLADELVNWKKQLEACRKPVPDSPDVAGLIRDLGEDPAADGEGARTITIGEAQNGERAKNLPVIVESKGSFESVFSLVRRIEQLDRLVRVKRVTIVRDKRAEDVLEATVQVDAYFRPIDPGIAAAGSDG